MQRYTAIFNSVNSITDCSAKKPLSLKQQSGENKRRPFFWCRRGDLNPHAVKHMNLNHACLPISPLRHIDTKERYPSGGADQVRTDDPHNAIVVLCQLSYDPVPRQSHRVKNESICQFLSVFPFRLQAHDICVI